MGKHLDNISDSLLKDLNEDIHDLYKSTKEMSASVEALQRETEIVFSQHFENLQKVYIELSEHASQDIREECTNQLDQLEKNIGVVLDKKISTIDKVLDAKIARIENMKPASGKKQNKLLIVVLIALVVAISAANFFAGSYLEQKRFDKVIEILPYLDTRENQ